MLQAFLLLFLAADTNQYPRHPLLDFSLNESDEKLAARFDRPPQVARGNGYYVLQFHAMPPAVIEENLQVEWLAASNAASCDGKFAYTAFFTQEGRLQSVLHQPDKRLPIHYLFPAGAYRDYEVTNASKLTFWYRVRRLIGGRVLLTTMYQKDLKFIDQVILVRESEIKVAFPLLEPLIAKE